MSTLHKLINEETTQKILGYSRGLADVKDDAFYGLVKNDLSTPVIEMVLETPNQLYCGVVLSGDRSDNSLCTGNVKTVKHQKQVSEKGALYSNLRDFTLSHFSQGDLELIGDVLYSEGMKYLQKNLPDLYRWVKDRCSRIDRVPGVGEGSITMQVGYLGKKNYILRYNPNWIARACLEEVFGEMLELPKDADFSNFDVFYLHDYLIVVASMFIAHEVLHLNYGHLEEETDEIPPVAKNIISDYYINSKLEAFFANDPYIKAVYKAVGYPEKSVRMKTLYSESFHFEGHPSEVIADDPPKTYGDFTSELVKIIQTKTAYFEWSGNFKFEGLQENDLITITPEDTIVFRVCINVVPKDGGLNTYDEYYKIVKAIMLDVFSEPPKVETPDITISIDDLENEPPPQPPGQPPQKVDLPKPKALPGSVVKLGDGSEAIITHINFNKEKDKWDYILEKAKKTVVTESFSLLYEVKSTTIVPKGWERTGEVLGVYGEDDFSVVKKSKPPKPPKSEGEPGEGEGDQDGDPSDGEPDDQKPSDKKRKERGKGKPDPTQKPTDDKDDDRDKGKSGEGDPSDEKDSSDKEDGEGESGRGKKDFSVGDLVIAPDGRTGKIVSVNPNGTYKVEEVTITESLLSEDVVSTGRMIGNFTADELKPYSQEKDKGTGEGEDEGESDKGEDEDEGEGKPKEGDDEGTPREKKRKTNQDRNLPDGKDKKKTDEFRRGLGNNVADEIEKKTGGEDSTLDPIKNPTKARFGSKKPPNWRRAIERAIENATGVEVGTDPDAPSRRYPGQYGEEYIEIVLEDFLLCFDVSGSMDIQQHYKIALDFIDDVVKRSNFSFSRVGVNIWSTNYYADRLKPMPKGKLLSYAKKVLGVAKGHEGVVGGGTPASSIFAPLMPKGAWKSAIPDLMIVFTDGHISNDLDGKMKSKVRIYQNRIIYVVCTGSFGKSIDEIPTFDPRAKEQGRIIKAGK